MMKLLIVCACIVAVQCGVEPKASGFIVRKLTVLCSAYVTDNVTVSDSTFHDVFHVDMLGQFCDDHFAALNKTATQVLQKVDGIKTLSTACKTYWKKYSEEPTEGPLVGIEAICNATKEAKAITLNTRTSRMALFKLTGLCDAQEAGKVRVKISNYTDVFVQLEGFCDVFMNTTIIVTRRKDYVHGIRVLGKVCRWYTDKFDEFPAKGNLAQLEPICEQYQEIQQALKEGNKNGETPVTATEQ